MQIVPSVWVSRPWLKTLSGIVELVSEFQEVVIPIIKFNTKVKQMYILFNLASIPFVGFSIPSYK
jgi:hypothetical protein